MFDSNFLLVWAQLGIKSSLRPSASGLVRRK